MRGGFFRSTPPAVNLQLKDDLAKQQGRRSRDRGRIITTTWGEPEPGGGLPFFYPIVSGALATPPCTLT
jgi:hypothetical protein